MGTCHRPRRTLTLSATLIAVTFAGLSLVLAAKPAAARQSLPQARDEGAVVVGGQLVMRLRPEAGGRCASDMADDVQDRLTDIVAVPDIKPWNVVVYTPADAPPAIYVLGRRFVTLNPATVRASGGASAKSLAVLWAKGLQQILPRIDIRLPNEPEPKVPAHPPLIIACSLAGVGGNNGPVDFRGKTVMNLRGVQPGGETAVERADTLSTRLNTLAYRLSRCTPDAVQVVSASASSAVIEMGGRPVYTVTQADARGAGAPSPMVLAHSWATKIRKALQ